MTFLCNGRIRTCYCERPDSLKFNCLFEVVLFYTGARCQLPTANLFFAVWVGCCCFPCRTFTQVSGQWQDSDSIREELDDLQACITNHTIINAPQQIMALHIWIINFTISLYWLWLTLWVILRSTDFLKHKMGYLVEPACRDVPSEQVSCYILVFS